MSVVQSNYFNYNRMLYQCKEKKNRKNRQIKEKEELKADLKKLKEEIEYLRRTNKELVKLFCPGKMIANSMTSEHEKCGLSSLLPMSCRGRAEAFARRLHSRLRSLGSHDENGTADENSWLAAHENPIALSQPRHADNETYLDFGLLESPGSPEEELHETELHRLLNKDHLKHTRSDECHCPKPKEKKEKLLTNFRSSSNDSDSDGPFYDTTDESEHRIMNGVNGDANSESSKSQDSETGICISSEDTTSNQEESFATTSDCTPQPCSSLSEDLSTLSLKDECISSESSESFTDLPKSDSETSNIYLKCNGDVNIEPLIDKTDSAEDTETYISCLSVDKDLTVECPTATQTQKLEIQLSKDPEEENDSEEEERIPRVRRCSSLKTGKTPPGTPGRKKIVRFADALGLDLADVRTFLDEIPKVPTSAFEDLTDVDLSDSSSMSNMLNNMSHGVKAEKILMPLFQQPGGLPNFLDLVRENQVCLENAFVDDALMLSIKGTVRVRNLDFHKSVYIRYTLDSWKTFADVQAVYVENSCDGFSDKFTFLIYAHTLSVGQRIEFACRFQCKGFQYWDNNSGANYCFQCLPASHNAPVSPITAVDDWGASFYYQEDDDDDEKNDPVEPEPDLTTTAVQDFILNTLATKEQERSTHHRKVDVLTVFVILVFSILFLYLQKAIYFTK